MAILPKLQNLIYQCSAFDNCNRILHWNKDAHAPTLQKSHSSYISFDLTPIVFFDFFFLSFSILCVHNRKFTSSLCYSYSHLTFWFLRLLFIILVFTIAFYFSGSLQCEQKMTGCGLWPQQFLPRLHEFAYIFIFLAENGLLSPNILVFTIAF
jgi:hypothetical protein